MYEPHIALLKEKVEEIGQQLKNGNMKWFEKVGIKIENKLSCNILSPANNIETSWNELTNGSVYNFQGQLWSFPFTRFYPLGSKESLRFSLPNFNDCQLIEKLDGKLVVVSYPTKVANCPAINTFNCIDFNFDDKRKKEYRIITKVQDIISVCKFKDINKTYIFEYIDEQTSTVKYDKSKYGLYLIGSRSLDSLCEDSEKELDDIAFDPKCTGVKRPAYYDIKSWSTVSEILQNKTFKIGEGFIIRDSQTGIRCVSESKKKIAHSLNQIVNQPVNQQPDTSLTEEEKVNFLEGLIEKWRDEKVKFLEVLIEKWRDDSSTPKKIRATMYHQNNPYWAIAITIKHLKTPKDNLKDELRKEILKITDGNLRRLEGLKT